MCNAVMNMHEGFNLLNTLQKHVNYKHQKASALLIGASLSEPHTIDIVVYGTTCIDRPTDRSIQPTDRVRMYPAAIIKARILLVNTLYTKYTFICKLTLT